MATTNQVREVHKLLDSLFDNSELSHAQIDLIRGLVPELPKQKTLEEITELVNEAWSFTHVNEWDDDAYGSLESWLSDLETQLQGVKETSANVPELPVGMRLAKHENYGRVVATDWIDSDNKHFCVYYSDVLERGSYVFLSEDSLTFIDSKPAHPKFLLTEGSYCAAPTGTVAARPGRFPWVKESSGDWSCSGGTNSDSAMAKSGQREVLRWGWGN